MGFCALDFCTDNKANKNRLRDKKIRAKDAAIAKTRFEKVSKFFITRFIKDYWKDTK